MYIPVFCLSKHDTAFGNFFSATYSNDFSDSDQAKQLNWTKQKKNTSQGVKNLLLGTFSKKRYSILNNKMAEWLA